MGAIGIARRFKTNHKNMSRDGARKHQRPCLVPLALPNVTFIYGRSRVVSPSLARPLFRPRIWVTDLESYRSSWISGVGSGPGSVLVSEAAHQPTSGIRNVKNFHGHRTGQQPRLEPKWYVGRSCREGAEAGTGSRLMPSPAPPSEGHPTTPPKSKELLLPPHRF